MRFIRCLSNLLIHPLYGKLIGIGLVFLPFMLMFSTRTISKLQFNWQFPILFIILSYIGLFFGGFIHECGHVITLRLLGCKSNISIIKNPHSRIIFFNMRTNLLNDHPLFSTTNRLMVRALSGLFGNMVAYLAFLIFGVLFNSISLLYLAAIQGFSGHGVTSFSSMNGDTDIRTLWEARSIDDHLDVNTQCIDGLIIFNIKVNLTVKNDRLKNYWIIVKGMQINQYEGDFIIFDMGSEYLFAVDEVRSGIFILNITGYVKDQVEIITKNSKHYIF